MNKFVLAITGGGAGALGKLLENGGGSEWLLEAIVPYSQQAFDYFSRYKAEKYCSPEAAENLAISALRRANKLTRGIEVIEGGPTNLIGLGCTASLFKEGQREGRENRAFICVCSYGTYLGEDGKTIADIEYYDQDILFEINNRKEQEEMLSDYIIRAVKMFRNEL